MVTERIAYILILNYNIRLQYQITISDYNIRLQYQITISDYNIRLQYQITISDITFFVSLTISSGYSKSLRTFTPPLTSEIPFVSL